MIEFDRDKQQGQRLESPALHSDELPYRVELWRSSDAVERVLGLASNVALARAIFRAAITEHPGRRVTLRRGDKIVGDSAS